MKKKVLFMVINMNIGGTEKALLNMINEMPREQYDITILMLEKYGGFLEHIPHWVNIKCFKGYKDIKGTIKNPPLKTIKDAFLNKHGLHAFYLFVLNLLSKFTKERSALFKYLLRNYPNELNEYDVAVAYAGPMDFISYFILNKINAKKKIQWIHFDVTKIGFNKRFAKKNYPKFNKVVVVSDEGKEKFLRELPSLRNKLSVFKNIVSRKQINRMANENIGFKDNYEGTRILTVGRLSKEKGQDLTIPVLAKLKGEGYDVKWYCIGEGKGRDEYEKLIKQYKLKSDYLFLGSTPNPYPFMKECDIYVQPSRYEGYCLTVIEAKFLNKPVITTNVNGAKEQIIHGRTGMIVPICENEIYLALKRLLDNKELQKKYSSNLKLEGLNSKSELNFSKLMI